MCIRVYYTTNNYYVICSAHPVTYDAVVMWHDHMTRGPFMCSDIKRACGSQLYPQVAQATGAPTRPKNPGTTS